MRSMGGVERSETFPEQHPERNANKKVLYRRMTRFWDSP